MVVVRGIDIGKRICETLGLDAKKVRSLNLSIPADDVVLLTTEYYMSEDEIDEIINIVKEYELHEIEE